MFPTLNKTFTESLLGSRHVSSSGEKMSKRREENRVPGRGLIKPAIVSHALAAER